MSAAIFIRLKSHLVINNKQRVKKEKETFESWATRDAFKRAKKLQTRLNEEELMMIIELELVCRKKNKKE